jgi:Rrf2 family protein
MYYYLVNSYKTYKFTIFLKEDINSRRHIMKISTKGKYALEAVVDLALNSQSQYESLKNIAERRNISEKYLEQIFSYLKRDKIVESVRGAQGGYRLVKEQDKITVGEILRATEGEFALVSCIANGEKKQYCDRHEDCVTRMLWLKIMCELNEVTDSITVKDLTMCYDKLYLVEQIEYYI